MPSFSIRPWYHLMGYVPAVQYTKAVPIHGHENEMFQSEHASLHKLFFGGDQLTVARARGALRTRGILNRIGYSKST